MLTDEEKAKIEALGGLDKLMEEFKKRMEEQKNAIREEINGSGQVELRLWSIWV